MEIEKQSSDKQQQKQKKQNFAKPSIKSRRSDQSIFSNTYAYLENPKNYDNLNQKMSIQSNVSQKVQLNKRKSDLFQHLVNEAPLSPIKSKNPFRISVEATYNKQTQTKLDFNKMSIQNISNPIDLKIKQEQIISLGTNNIKTQLKEDLKVESPQIKITCKCYKSKCLQLYCQCFSKGILCNAQCQCYQCRNNEDFKDKLEKARNSILQKDPQAFSNKLQIVGNIQTQINLANKKGCNCKKTLCIKKYCECFYSGVKCTYLCKCQNCCNSKGKQ